MKLETKMDIVIANQESQAVSAARLNEKLDKLLPTYATKTELEKMKKTHNLQVWITGTLSAAFGIIMTLLLQSFFSNLG